MNRPNILDRIAKPAQLTYRKCLFFGPSGAGKTWFLGTAEDEPRVQDFLILSFESNISTLVGCNVDVLPITDWQDYNEVYEMLTSDAGRRYRGIAVDSLSETHIFSLMNIVETQADSQKGGRLFRDLSPEQSDYGKSLIQMRRFIRAFRNIPAHIFFTAGVKTDTVPKEGWVRFPNLSGTLAEEVVGMFDVTGYMTQSIPTDINDRPARVMALQNYAGIRAKVQTTWKAEFPNEIVWPTMTKLFDLLEVPPIR